MRSTDEPLEHEHPPERGFAIGAAEVGAPDLLDTFRVEDTAADLQQLLGPGAEGGAEPVGEGEAEAALLAVDHRLGNEARQERAEEPLAAAVADLHRERERPRELDEAVVEQRLAGLEAHRHARAVDFHENV